ncbi:MAG: PAS domain S-box protein [Flavobacterium sp.]
MKHKIISSSKLSSFKIVFLYIIFSTIYIYTSDYFVRKLVTDVELMSEIQSYKGIAFILITALFLYIVVKKNIDTTSSYDKQIIDLKQNGAQQIEKSHDEYMSLFNHSPLPKWIFDIKTLQFLLVNDAACDTYGYTKEEFLSLTLKDIRPKEDISILEETLRNTFEKGLDEQNRILRHSKKNKEIIYVRTKGKFITFEGKKARLITCMDITNEIEARDKLTEINSKLQLASEIANLGYWTNDLIESKIQ